MIQRFNSVASTETRYIKCVVSHAMHIDTIQNIKYCCKLTSKTKTVSGIYNTGLFCDTRISGFSKQDNVLVFSYFEYFFLTCLYRGQSSNQR